MYSYHSQKSRSIKWHVMSGRMHISFINIKQQHSVVKPASPLPAVCSSHVLIYLFRWPPIGLPWLRWTAAGCVKRARPVCSSWTLQTTSAGSSRTGHRSKTLYFSFFVCFSAPSAFCGHGGHLPWGRQQPFLRVCCVVDPSRAGTSPPRTTSMPPIEKRLRTFSVANVCKQQMIWLRWVISKQYLPTSSSMPTR